MSLARPSRENTLRVLGPEGTARLLRIQLIGHNLQVLWVAATSIGLMAVVWITLYVVAYWLTLVGNAIGQDPDSGVSQAFPGRFLLIAVSSLVCAWLAKRLLPKEIAWDERPLWRTILDILLALPRATLTALGTILACRRLSRTELREAASFIHRLSGERRLPLSSVPLELPSEGSRERVLIALQLMQIVDLQRIGKDWFVTLHASRPKAFQFDRMAGGDRR